MDGAALILLPFLLVGLYLAYLSWVKPMVVRRLKWKREDGPDLQVSGREMYMRTAWRYDTWTDRILSLLVMLLTLFFWIMILTGH